MTVTDSECVLVEVSAIGNSHSASQLRRGESVLLHSRIPARRLDDNH